MPAPTPTRPAQVEPIFDPWLPANSTPPDRHAIQFWTYRYDPDAAAEERIVRLPDLDCLTIQSREGPDPGVAVFRYNFATTDPDSPASIEQAWGSAGTFAKAVGVDTRLVVYAVEADGTSRGFAFDGIAASFSMGVGPRAESVEITAVGIAHRCRDTPIGGAILRNEADQSGNAPDVPTDLPAIFNPRGKPNATQVSDRTVKDNNSESSYSVFIDPEIVLDPDVRISWTLSEAARHLIFVNNPTETYVTSPLGSDLDSTLVSREPIDGKDYDPADPSTYTQGLILAPSLPITGKDWPSALKALIGEAGFGMRWDIDQTDSDEPQTKLVVFHPQTGPVKDVWLQPRGSLLDTNLSNTDQAGLTRDLRDAANVWTVTGAPARYECSVVLAPGYPADAADASEAALMTYFLNNLTDATRDKYRLYVYDETGEGHYTVGTATRSTTPTSLDPILGAPTDDVPAYAGRRRPPIGRLFTTDGDQAPLRYNLSYSTDYAGPEPGVWDGTGTWQSIGHHGYELLQDRLGIRLTDDSPNAWSAGKDSNGTTIMIYGVQAQAAPDAQHPRFHLRLTCVIESDRAVSATVARRSASPLARDVTRVVDARDRYRKQIVAPHSEYNNYASPITNRDDTAACQAEATALQLASDCGLLSGEITLTNATLYYEIGDRIRSINGRNIGLRTDGDPAGTPIYPVVVGVRHDILAQRTILQISDARPTGPGHQLVEDRL